MPRHRFGVLRLQGSDPSSAYACCLRCTGASSACAALARRDSKCWKLRAHAFRHCALARCPAGSCAPVLPCMCHSMCGRVCHTSLHSAPLPNRYGRGHNLPSDTRTKPACQSSTTSNCTPARARLPALPSTPARGHPRAHVGACLMRASVAMPAQRVERPRAPGGVAAFASVHSKTPHVTPSMKISSWGRGSTKARGAAAGICVEL